MKLVILDGFAVNPGDLTWDGLRALADVTVYDRTPAEQIIPRIGDAELVLVNKTPISAETLAACPSIRMIGLFATGYNVVDVEAAAARGIPVCNVPTYSTDAVAQMALAHLLALCQRVETYTAACRAGEWTRAKDFCFWNASFVELRGKTLGIIGYGTIGRAFGKIAKAMGMNLLVNARHPDYSLEDAQCKYVDLDTLCANADVISLHCPLTAETRELINRERIAKMKDGVLLINTSRGGLVNEADLAEALRSGKVGGAGVDVVSVEPIRAGNPLLHAPNCNMTPHIAWAPFETRKRLIRAVEENVAAFLRGKPINVVNGL